MTGNGPELDATQHAAMDRVRELHARDRAGEKAARQRPWWPRVIGLVLALGVVGTFALGLDAFLAAYQRLLDTPAAEEQKRPADEAIPVFVVPESEPVEPPTDSPPAAD
jgi:hypothetical protein